MVGDGTRNGYCMRSCGYCDGSGDTIATCSDFDDNCAWWAEQQQCGKSAHVDVYCAASCGTCDTVVIDDTAGECSNGMDGSLGWGRILRAAQYVGCAAAFAGLQGCHSRRCCRLLRLPCCPAAPALTTLHNRTNVSFLLCPSAGNCYDNDPFNCAFYAAEGFCDPASDL